MIQPKRAQNEPATTTLPTRATIIRACTCSSAAGDALRPPSTCDSMSSWNTTLPRLHAMASPITAMTTYRVQPLRFQKPMAPTRVRRVRARTATRMTPKCVITSLSMASDGSAPETSGSATPISPPGDRAK